MTVVVAFLGLLGYDKETLMIAAFGTLVGAGVIVSVGAWILFARERRLTRRQSAEAVPSGDLHPDSKYA